MFGWKGSGLCDQGERGAELFDRFGSDVSAPPIAEDCTVGQGCLFGEPKPPEAVPGSFRRWTEASSATAAKRAVA